MSPVSSIVVAAMLQLLNSLCINNMLSCCPYWRKRAQEAASHLGFSCKKMAKCQSSVLAGDSGDSGRPLRQGSGDGSSYLGCSYLAARI
jgi:hypothetical protein